MVGVGTLFCEGIRPTFGAPVGIRTPNLLIRSQMLYPLSYGRMANNCVESRNGSLAT
jgi:hypothetical protein